MPARSQLASARRDEAVYPTEEKVGEESLQRFILELLRPMIERWLSEQGQVAFTGADQFIYYRRGDATERVAPDIFVLPGVRPGRRIKSWKLWSDGVVPSFALEVVSGDFDKDYIEAPRRYEEIGVNELVIFDPDFEVEPGRFRFQVFRRVRGRKLTRAFVSNEDRVRSRALGCYLRAVGTGETTRLRLAVGSEGQELIATESELLERERAEKERERAEKERERAGRLAAEAALEALRRRISGNGRRPRPKKK